MTGHYCRCGSALASDNADRLCASCQARRRRDRAPDVPPEFWQTEALSDALASGDLGRVIRAYRCHPFHGERLPQTLIAGWLHMSQAAMSRIESGRRRVTIDEIAHIAQVLGMPVVAVRWTPQQSGEDVEPFSRRSLLGVGVGAALGLNATTAPTAAREIDPELASHWLKLLRVLGRHDASFGPREVVAPVRRELGLIAEHRQLARGELRAQLLGVEARWAWFASWLSHDTGDWHRRDSWTNRALQLAREADDHEMVAWGLMWQSRWAAMRHDATRAIMLADSAGRTKRATDTMRGLCALRLAHGHALDGDASTCRRALADAYEILDDAPPSDGATPWDDLGRQSLDSPPCVLADEARCWLSLEPHTAIHTLENVLRLWPGDRTRGRGIQQARLALACVGAGDIDRATNEGIAAVQIARATRSHTTVRELRRLDHKLAACDAPAAADFREAFATL